MAISISRNLLPHFHPFDRDGNIARRVTRSFRTCVEFPWQKTNSNPAPVAFRLIEELNNRNCFLRLCSRAIVEDTRAWPRKAWLPSRSRIKGSNCTSTPCFMCVYAYPIRVYVYKPLCSPPLSMEVETLHDYLCTKLLSPGIVLIDSRILTRILERGVVRVSLNT